MFDKKYLTSSSVIFVNTLHLILIPQLNSNIIRAPIVAKSGYNFASAVQDSGLLNTTSFQVIIVNSANDAPFGNGIYILFHSPNFWNKFPNFIFESGSTMKMGYLNCSDINNIIIENEIDIIK